MHNEYLSKLFDYDNEVNQKVLDHLLKQSVLPDRVRAIFTHIVMTKKVWLKRIRGEDWSHLSIWPDFGLEKCKDLISENRKEFHKFLADKSETDLQENIRYTNSKGIDFENSIRDILMHLLIHGGYHRGQIAKIVRETGGEPVNTDYIMHIREPI